MKAKVIALAATTLLVACASSPDVAEQSAPAPSKDLPDARDLSEHPLDILGFPQP